MKGIKQCEHSICNECELFHYKQMLMSVTDIFRKPNPCLLCKHLTSRCLFEQREEKE